MVTIKDVAKEAGLSVGTVSRVFNNRGYISNETRKKVESAMKKIGYQPNAIARSLSKAHSTIIGVIIPIVKNPYFAEMLECISSELSASHYQMLFFTSDGDSEKEKDFLDECKRNRVAAIILCSGNFDSVRLDSYDVPVIAIECQKSRASVLITCDNYEGGYLAAEHLYSAGSRHPVCIAGYQDEEMPADERVSGYKDWCEKNGIETVIYSAGKDAFHSSDYYSTVEKALSDHPETDGFFASSDVIAAEIIQTLARHEIRIPDDVKVVGFDGSILSRVSNPSITSIRQPVEEMARLAVDSAIRAAERKSVSSSIKVGVQLLVRDSTIASASKL